MATCTPLPTDPGAWSRSPSGANPIVRIQTTTTLSGSGSAKLLEWNGSAYAVTGDAFTLRDPFLLAPAAKTGFQGFAVQFADRGDYELLGPTDRRKLAKVDGNWVKGSQAAVEIYDGTLGSETATGIEVDAWNKWADVDGSATALWVWIEYIPGSGWYFVQAEC